CNYMGKIKYLIMDIYDYILSVNIIDIDNYSDMFGLTIYPEDYENKEEFFFTLDIELINFLNSFKDNEDDTLFVIFRNDYGTINSMYIRELINQHKCHGIKSFSPEEFNIIGSLCDNGYPKSEKYEIISKLLDPSYAEEDEEG